MKKKVTFLRAEESKKALNMLQNCLRPDGINHIIFSKENTGYETRREIRFCAYVDKKQYKQLKAYAQAADAIENANTEFYEENPDAETSSEHVELPENVKEALAKHCAILLALANHEDCEK